MQLTRLRVYHEVDASGDKRTCHVFLTIAFTCSQPAGIRWVLAVDVTLLGSGVFADEKHCRVKYFRKY